MSSCGFNDWNVLDYILNQMYYPKSQVFLAVVSGFGRIVLRLVTETSQSFYIIQIPSLNLCQAFHCAH